jgi:hypothetical protein
VAVERGVGAELVAAAGFRFQEEEGIAVPGFSGPAGIPGQRRISGTGRFSVRPDNGPTVFPDQGFFPASRPVYAALYQRQVPLVYVPLPQQGAEPPGPVKAHGKDHDAAGKPVQTVKGAGTEGEGGGQAGTQVGTYQGIQAFLCPVDRDAGLFVDGQKIGTFVQDLRFPRRPRGPHSPRGLRRPVPRRIDGNGDLLPGPDAEGGFPGLPVDKYPAFPKQAVDTGKGNTRQGLSQYTVQAAGPVVRHDGQNCHSHQTDIS